MRRGKVGILTTYHVHNDGERIIYGGAERYGVEFSKMLVEMGFDVAWWQIGSGWTAEVIPGVPLYTIPAGESAYQTCPVLNQAFHEQAEGINYAVYFTTLLAYPTAMERSLSISHGIYWDYPLWEQMVPTEAHRREWRHRWKNALERVPRIVSCDTATIRFVNGTWPALSSKMEYVPNFVDLTEFGPSERDGEPHDDSNDDRSVIRILYPRRLTAVRGINDTLAAISRLNAEYDNLEFHIVGRGHNDAREREMLAWAAQQPNVYYYWQPPHAMPRVYRNMDIVLIPTKGAEGTSLSCLEAMGSGRAVIAGCVGGLTDLIVDGYNGLLLRPLTANSLVDAIRRLVEDPKLRRQLGRNALATAGSFSLEQWKARWADVIERTFTG